MLPCTDRTILIPYFDGHDVAILQGDTVTVQYYWHVPSCVKEYKYLVTSSTIHCTKFHHILVHCI